MSRPALIASRFSTVICAPVHTRRLGLSTEVAVGTSEGLRHESAILCDGLASLPKAMLTDYVGSLSESQTSALARSLRIALHVE